MDIQMPVMDGYTATRNIRAMEDPAIAGVPIIALTANAFEEDEKATQRAGMQAHISKPIEVDVLMRTLAEIL
jgi:CheY-like chemotaxis protein